MTDDIVILLQIQWYQILFVMEHIPGHFVLETNFSVKSRSENTALQRYVNENGIIACIISFSIVEDT